MRVLRLLTTVSLIFVILILAVSIFIFQNNQTIQQLKTTIKRDSFKSVVSSHHATQKSLYRELTVYNNLSNSTPSEAFVTFSNNEPKYLALLTKVLDTVHLFSTRPIIVYGIDIDLKIDTAKYPRLVKRRLNQKDCGPNIFFCKIYCISHSRVDYGVYIEADTLVNWNVDILFDVLHRWPYHLPLAPRHPDDPNNYNEYLRQFGLSLKSRTTPYIHAHILWNYRAYPFLRHAASLMQRGYFMGANYDETGINMLLWQAKANHTLCKIDPFVDYLPAYESSQMLCKEYCHTAYILIHGSKQSSHMENIIERLKNRTGSPFIQTPHAGFHYLNETQHTCCYPDSRPSSIHPLLCEHPR